VKNLGWGLEMTLLGMGAVFLLLIMLMGVLMAVGRIDRLSLRRRGSEQLEAPREEEDDRAVDVVVSDPSGLTPEQIAAIGVAVMVHVEVRRKEAAPVHRVHPPGSRLWASRWVADGRSAQMHNTQMHRTGR
jgi:Na+-transporting methylmalonyl-CoA/oxaloacetate decarboxylase gamma subunit